MSVIWKYSLLHQAHNTLTVPDPMRALCVQIQHNTTRLWIECAGEGGRMREVHVYCVGTGHNVPQSFSTNNTYINTIQDGPYVWHYFIKYGDYVDEQE